MNSSCDFKAYRWTASWLERALPANRRSHSPLRQVWGTARILTLYRYISLLITSAFYLMGSSRQAVFLKAGVVGALLISGRLTVYLYDMSSHSKNVMSALIAAETLGIAALLIPTGGLESPFKWYALNPILMSAALLSPGYRWAIAGGFLTAALLGSMLLSSLALSVVWRDYSWFLLVVILLTSAAGLFSRLLDQLSSAYEDLTKAHEATERSLEHTRALYQALEALAIGDDTRSLARLLADYSVRLSSSGTGFCYFAADSAEPVLEIRESNENVTTVNWSELLEELWCYVKAGEDHNLVLSCFRDASLPAKSRILWAAVQSKTGCYGILGCLSLPKDSDQSCLPSLRFLAELGALAYERRRVQELTTQLRVSQEQTRMANEIHDGVCQYLFSVSCGLHSLSRKSEAQSEEIQEHLRLLMKSVNQANRDLRTAIYRIDRADNDKTVFAREVASFLDDLAVLYEVHVSSDIKGSEDSLSPALRQVLYCIIREASSNAVRHGHCNRIHVDLDMNPHKVVVSITDDGQGFMVGPDFMPASGAQGRGLASMHSLMRTFGGSLRVDSHPGQGTTITCCVPAGDHLA